LDTTASSNPISIDDQTLKTIFTKYDTSRDGRVSTNELGSMLGSLDIDLSPDQLQTMMEEADPDGSGQIEFEEFKKAMYSKALEGCTVGGVLQTMRAVFDTFDHDKSGKVDTEELRAICERLKMHLQPGELERMMKEADPDSSGHIDFGEFVVTVGEQLKKGGKFAEVYQKALNAVNEASKEGADWVKGLNPLVAAAQLAKARQPTRRAFLGAPTNGSYALVAEMGTPPDADCSERARDTVLGFFVAQNTLFMVLAGISALVIVGFGVAIGVFLLSAIIGAEIFTLTDIYPECTNKTRSIELYLERNPSKYWTERDGVYAPATHNKVDRVFGQGMHKVCTDGQLWFNICIKVFTFVFSYINLLPVPWRFAILCDAYDTENRNKGQVGLMATDGHGWPL
jgi:Ca2+-binding EF-hand superfamily protein